MTEFDWTQFWLLDSQVTFLNHGSFGACPIPVLEAQQRWRDRLERQPLQFLGLEIEGLLDAARSDLAAFVGAASEELVFVTNATTGVNTVLRSLALPIEGSPKVGSGDELLTTNHEYNACRNALNFVADCSGAEVVVAEIPFPLTSPEEIIAAVLAKVSSRTKLALLDHVSSQTGLVFPITALVQELRDRGIETVVDGAHAPGMVALDLHQIGAAYYTGNCHKWVCAPKGAAFLYVRQDLQSGIRPLVISHGANSPRCDRSRFHLEFDWMGTGDPTAYLCIPTALQWMGSLLPGGWSALMAQNHHQILEGREILCQALSLSPPCPEEMVGSMAAIPLPENLPDRLYSILTEEFRIEVPIIPWLEPYSRLMRISAQLYNTQQQYKYLASALQSLQKS